MKKLFLQALFLLGLCVVPEISRAGFLDDMLKEVGVSKSSSAADALDENTVAKGLKEALATGTGRAVATVSKQDGYFGNQAIRILMPENLRYAADLLSKFGFQKEVDEFVLSMNRAAEKAAPKAAGHFMAALKAMTFDDARKILQGDDTSATEYFRQKSGKDIYASFKPIISTSLHDVGAVQSYKHMMEKFNSIPFAGSMISFDLDDYVANKAVEGLFSMVGDEEKNIRANPAARGTELLKKVFGK